MATPISLQAAAWGPVIARGAYLGYKAYKAYKSMPSLRGYKPKRKAGKLGRLRSVRRKLFHDVSGGDYAARSSVVRGKAKKMGLKARIYRAMYPPYSVTDNTQTGLDYDGPNQGVMQYHLLDKTAILQHMAKAKDVYNNGSGLVMEDNMPAGETGVAVSNTKFNLDSFIGKVKFLNSCSATQTIEVLMLTPNRFIEDTDNTWADPMGWWARCNEHAKALTNVNGAGGVNGDSPNATPQTAIFDRPYKRETKGDFARYWKICSKHRRILQPGQLWNYNFVRKNRSLHHQDLTQYGRIPGLTYYMLIIVNGQVMNGSTAGFGDVSYSSGQIAMMVHTKYTYSYQTANRRVTMRTAGPPTVLTANQRFMEDDELVTDTYREL